MKNWIDTTVGSYAEDFEQARREQDRRPLAERADPLALSWAAYHVWTKWPNRRWVEWRDLEAHEHDRAMAEETRRYYRNKLALRTLRGDEGPTQFAQDLYDICNGGIMRECHRGMLYRLPYFYVEDTQRAELIEETQHQPSVADVIPAFLQEKTTRSLRRYSRIFHSRRSREIMEYWFHDTATSEAVLWSVAYDNPLRSLVEHYWQTHATCEISARWLLGHDRASDFQFWRIVEPELRFG